MQICGLNLGAKEMSHAVIKCISQPLQIQEVIGVKNLAQSCNAKISPLEPQFTAWRLSCLRLTCAVIAQMSCFNCQSFSIPFADSNE